MNLSTQDSFFFLQYNKTEWVTEEKTKGKVNSERSTGRWGGRHRAVQEELSGAREPTLSEEAGMSMTATGESLPPVLSFLYSSTLTSIHDYWKNHSLN